MKAKTCRAAIRGSPAKVHLKHGTDVDITGPPAIASIVAEVLDA